jgi:hypothetical protein
VASAQDLVDAVITRLGEISVANGYHTDAGAQVTGEPERVFAEDAPATMLCAYLDAVGKPTDPALRTVGWLADVIVVAKRSVAADGRQQGQVELLEDIERAMAERKGWPAGASAPTFQEAKFINRAEGLPWVGVAVRYSSHLTRPRA